MNLFSPFDPSGIVQLIEAHARSVKDRIQELETKQRRKTADNAEINELAIMCDYNDFNVHQELIGIARTRQADFTDNNSYLNHVRTLLHQAHIDPAIVRPQAAESTATQNQTGAGSDAGPADHQTNDCDPDIQVAVVSQRSFTRTATLDSILFDLEHALLPDWTTLLHKLHTNSSSPGKMPGTRAFWVDQENIFPVEETHIRYILDNPGPFGFRYERLREEFRAAGEPIGFEGKARRRIISRAINKGWLRARLYERRAHQRSYLGITIDGLNPKDLPLRILFCYLIEHKLIRPDEEVQIVDLGDRSQPLYSYPRLLGGAAGLLSDLASGQMSARIN